MPILQTIYILLLLASAGVCFAYALLMWQRRPRPWAVPLSGVMGAVSWWVLFNALEVAATTLEHKMVWINTLYLGVVLLPVAFFLFCLTYAKLVETIQWWWAAGLLVIPAVTTTIIWLNPNQLFVITAELNTHNLFPTMNIVQGIWFWVHAFYTYSLIAAGLACLGWVGWYKNSFDRYQSRLVFYSVIPPLLGNVLSVAKFLPFDVTGFSFSLTGLILGWGLLRYELFELSPLAQQEMLNHLTDGLIVIDKQGFIVQMNDTAGKVLGNPAEFENQTWGNLLKQNRFVPLSNQLAQKGSLVVTRTLNQVTEVYEIFIRTLPDEHGRQLCVVRDITEPVTSKRTLEQANQQFTHLVTLAQTLGLDVELPKIISSILTTLVPMVLAQRGLIEVLNENGWVIRGSYSPGREVVINTQPMPAAWLRRVPAEGVLVQNGGIAEDSQLVVPLWFAGQLMGTMILAHPEPDYFQEEQVQLITAARDQIALALGKGLAYEEQKQQATRQATLYQFLEILGTILDPQQVLEQAVHVIVELTHCHASAILVYDPAGKQLAVRAAEGILKSRQGEIIALSASISGRVFINGRSENIDNLSIEENRSGDIPQLLSGIFVPLLFKGENLGVFTMQSHQQKAFNDQDVQFAEALADAIILAYRNALLHNNLSEYATHLNFLYTTTQIMSQMREVKEILQETLRATLQFTGFDMGLISMSDPAGQLTLAETLNMPPAVVNYLKESGLNGTICDYVFQTKNMLILGDVNQENSTRHLLMNQLPKALPGLHRLQAQAYLGTPLVYKGQKLGTICLFAHRPKELSPELLRIHRAIIQDAASMLANAELFERVTNKQIRLQALLESNRDAVIFFDFELRIDFVNRRAVEFLEVDLPPEAWQGLSFSAFLRHLRHTRPGLTKAIMAQLHVFRNASQDNITGRLQVGRRLLQWASYEVRLETEQIGRLLVLRDITEEQAVQRLRDDLTRMMVHDLRNPIGSAYTAAEFLGELIGDTLNEDDRKLLENIKLGSSMALKLVNSILELSRLESGALEIEPTMFALSELAQEVLAVQEAVAQNKGITLQNQIGEELIGAWADYQLIERVLQNLVGNSLKFTPAGGTITLSAKLAKLKRGERLLVAVCDNGPGIPEEIRPTLFNKFVKGHQAESGTGLGLAFCKMAVEAHGEEIWVEESSEHGTTIIFTLKTLNVGLAHFSAHHAFG